MKTLVLSVFLLAGAAAGDRAWSQARLVHTEGAVTLDGRPVAAGAEFDAGELRTGADGGAQLRFIDGTLAMLGAGAALALPRAGYKELSLSAGGLRLATGSPDWILMLGDRQLRATGFVKLQWCRAEAGCTIAPGLYGSVAQGEAVLEYQGGRSVLRNRHFRWDGPAARPEILAQPPLLAVDAPRRAAAEQARVAVAAQLKAGIEAFGADQDVAAIEALKRVRDAAPGEPLVPYYLGLIALRRQDNAERVAATAAVHARGPRRCGCSARCPRR
jgi:hypothetical protein